MLDDFTKIYCQIFPFSKYSFDQQDVCIASVYDFDYTLVQRPLVKEFITIKILWIDKDWLISYSTFIFFIDWHSINLWCVLINMSGYLPWGWGLVRKHTVIAISTLFKGELNNVNINSEHLLNHLTYSRQCTPLLKECNHSGLGTWTELRNPIVTLTESGSKSESESEWVIEKKIRSQIGVKVVTTPSKVLPFYEPVTLFFILINIKKDNTYYVD